MFQLSKLFFDLKLNDIEIGLTTALILTSTNGKI